MFTRFLRTLRPQPDAPTAPVLVVPPAPPLGYTPPPDPALRTCPADTVLNLDSCPGCGEEGRTPLFRFNRFALFSWQPDERAATYNYAMCHGCGIVYATRRPAGPRYEWLMQHFEETLGRGESVGKIAITSRQLEPSERERLRALAAKGVYVSDHLGLKSNEYIPALMRERLTNSPHVEVIGSLIPMRNPRVLEIRSRLGSIADALRRLFDADVRVMTLFENQQFLIQEVYGMEAVCGIDFDRFRVPFEGTFDVVVANHMLTHAVRPADFLTEVRSRLAPGGHLYLYNEFSESHYLERGKSLFTINPFHLQVYSGPSLARLLAANGFTITFMTTFEDAHVCVARRDDAAGSERPQMSERERARRRSRYRTLLETSILTLPAEARWRVPDWTAVVQKAVADGTAEVTRRGDVRLSKARDD
jgi:SAM-dependent methyltransferase